MSTETTKLLPKKLPPAASGILPIFKELSLSHKIFSIPRLAWRWHGYAIMMSLISAFVNWRLGFAEVNIFDPMIFKSLFVVFGFTVGFRNVNAAERHAQGVKHCNELLAAVWGIIILFVHMDDCRQRVHDSFRRVLQAFASHIILISDRRSFWYALADLDPLLPSCSQVPSASPSKEIESLGSDGAAKDSEQPEQKNAAAAFMSDAACKASALGRTAALAAAAAATAPFGDDWAATATPTLISAEAGFSPRLLFTSTLVWCEEELEKYETPLGQQKLRRAFWLHRQQAITAYQEMESLAMPSVGHRYVMLIDLSLFIFAACLPWGMSVHPLISRIYYSEKDPLSASGFTAGLCLMANTLLCTMVLFGLNGLAREQEDPFNGNGDEDIDMYRLVGLFDSGLRGFEARSSLIKDAVKSDSSKANLVRADLLDAIFADVGLAYR
eukprot:TRINITY_DN5346_c0_g1_i1.p1 TRINITY_DN5346_c0_g1~~TRINITY_DN5346_c0_g1_i1.p1  ORF type:complete len:475 (-),score=81.77 TRINITY_DN5346_c0_g1_i1:91-1413(-)